MTALEKYNLILKTAADLLKVPAIKSEYDITVRYGEGRDYANKQLFNMAVKRLNKPA